MKSQTKIGLDKKGIFSFLIITFVITFGIEIGLILNGVSPIVYGLGQYVIAAVMWVPALATFITIKFITKEGFKITNIRFGNWKPYLYSGLLIPLCFLIIYFFTYIFGLGNPDWEMTSFKRLLGNDAAAIPDMPSPVITWGSLYIATLVMAPLINTVFGFGEELGWRGYLLPKLLPLGKYRAYIILGIIWGLWHLPLVLVGFMYPGYPLTGAIMFTLLTIIFGIYINELTLKYQSSILAGWIHGIFNSQRLGVWTLLFPGVNPLFGGFSGVIGLVVWLVLGLVVCKRKGI